MRNLHKLNQHFCYYCSNLRLKNRGRPTTKEWKKQNKTLGSYNADDCEHVKRESMIQTSALWCTIREQKFGMYISQQLTNGNLHEESSHMLYHGVSCWLH